jgi:hypothetical protein
MDSLHAIGFYASSGVLLLGGLGVAVAPGRDLRGIAVAVCGFGLAGAYLSLSSGMAAIVALVAYAGCALMVAWPRYRLVDVVVSPLWRQVGAVGAALLLAALAYSAFRGDYVHAAFRGGSFDARSVAQLLLGHDVLATEAIAALGLAALAGAAAAWRVRERAR